MDARTWLLALLLAAGVIALQVVIWLTRSRVDEQTYSGPPRSDYTLTDFTLNALDESGQLSFRMTGPHLARRGDDGSVYVTTPKYLMLDGSGNPWNGTSDSAWVNKDGSIMLLDGNVDMHRDATESVQPVRVVTTNLTTRPKDKTMETAAPAQISQPGTILTGTGMRGDLNTKTLELLSDVHNTYQSQKSKPRKPKAGAKPGAKH